MAFREKTAWITLVTTVLVYGAYFAIVGPDLFQADGPKLGFVAPLSAAIVAIAVLQAALIAAAAVFAPGEARLPRDEREKLIELQASRAAFYTLQVGAFGAIVSLFWWNDARVMANGVFLAMVVAEAGRACAQIAGYRRAAA